MNLPRTPGDAVCDAFRLAVEKEGLGKVETGAALATLLAGFIGIEIPDEQADAILDLISETAKVQIAEHRKILCAPQTRRSPFLDPKAQT